jgi:hypothetical protein
MGGLLVGLPNADRRGGMRGADVAGLSFWERSIVSGIEFGSLLE